MRKRTLAICLSLFFGCFLGLLTTPVFSEAADEGQSGRSSLWIDFFRGEPLSYEEVLDDLAGVDVVYLGEYHGVDRHHEIQRRIVTDLAQRGRPLVLAMEQLESFQQPDVDRYNRGEIDFDQLAEAIEWGRRWGNYKQYRPIVEAARKANIPVLALNARSETIRQVARSGGLDRMDPKARSELPADIWLDDPAYRKRLSLQMMVHAAANPETLRPMIEAQIARDEAMASALCSFLKSEAGRGRAAIVLCGAAHVTFGQGTASRVRRRLPEIKERIVRLSASSDVVLSPQSRAVARPVIITHEQLRQIDRPIADYLYVTSLKTTSKPPATEKGGIN
ncbi:MAG: ChaN family lipoprotein [Planctomycetes bacterium]|nr:ChaN family lipoprotein [Planctomycetota bacterium]MBU4400878.1 ChaN family lipoprotein [Planctomycetota bacterium]MCG2682405.1 ChaN family lipoprotein [Planctomycetales bacterium]